MKKLFNVSLLALAIIAGVSCSKEDNNNNTTTTQTKSDVVGEWKMTKYDQDGDQKMNGQAFSTYTSTGSNFAGSIIFKADNTYSSDVSYDSKIVTKIPGVPDVTQTVSLSGFPDSGTWKINADGDLEATSTVNGSSQTSVIEIASLSSNKMVWKFSTSQTQTQQGVTAVVTANARIELEK